jgi:3-hydroxybutyryl-CoA dehydrogenase
MIIRVIRVMQVVVLTNDVLKEELLSDSSSLNEEIIWIENIHQISEHQNVDVFIDLLFNTEHITILQSLLPKTVIINSVEKTLAEIDSSFVRINAWPGFLKSSTIEASSLNDRNKEVAQKVFALFKKKLEWLPDESGFVTPRVISTIINEALIALMEGVSTREEIDTAMKLGTNYPYGPFEWAEKIGMERVDSLLVRLQKK